MKIEVASSSAQGKNIEKDGAIKVSFGGGAAKNGDDEQSKESNSEGKKPDALAAGNQVSAVDKVGIESDGIPQKSGGGNSGKKKTKNSPNNVSEPAGGTVPMKVITGSPTLHSGTVPGPPRQHVYEYPTYTYAPPPVYGVSYNTAYPSSSYGASYYAPPPPYSYAYTDSERESEPAGFNASLPPASDSFELFSDENPNACSVM